MSHRTRASFAALAMVGAALSSAPAAAQSTGAGLGRALTRPRPRAPREEAPAREAPPSRDPEPEREEALRWPGPQIQLLYGYTKLADGFGGGDAHTGGVAVFLQWPLHELRTAVHAEVGARDYSLAGADLLARGALEVGFQLPHVLDPVVPHVSAVLSVGALVGERFDTTVAHAVAGGGFEIGAAVRLLRALHLTAAFGYQRVEMDGAAYDLFQLRLGAGL